MLAAETEPDDAIEPYLRQNFANRADYSRNSSINRHPIHMIEICAQ